MTVGYEEGVIIISLAMFGLYAIIEELWHIRWRSQEASSVTILLIVQNAEAVLERLVRTILEDCVTSEQTELVIADVASTDRTRAILYHLAEETETLRIVHSETKRQAIADGMVIARGDFIQVCDLMHRVNAEECTDYLGRLAKVE